jgi:uncharacterized protein (DUF2141 family)
MKIWFLLILLPCLVFAQNSGNLKVVMEGFETDDGCVRIALANSEDSYDSHDEVYRGASEKITAGVAVHIFENIPYGEYAVKVFHDENDNSDLDTNFLGIPSEDYGFSNNASGTFGPPAWDQARFFFSAELDSIQIYVD